MVGCPSGSNQLPQPPVCFSRLNLVEVLFCFLTVKLVSSGRSISCPLSWCTGGFLRTPLRTYIIAKLVHYLLNFGPPDILRKLRSSPFPVSIEGREGTGHGGTTLWVCLCVCCVCSWSSRGGVGGCVGSLSAPWPSGRQLSTWFSTQHSVMAATDWLTSPGTVSFSSSSFPMESG